MSRIPIYRISPAEVFPLLETSVAGLSAAEAHSRLQLYGENRLVAAPPLLPWWFKALRYFLQPFSLVLGVAGVLALFLDPTLSVIIFSLTLANALFAFQRERRVERAVEKLQAALPAFAHLMREGQEYRLPASEVVPGDILILEEGDNIPADARVVEEYGLRVNNATLTGEALPARKIADASFLQGLSELEQPNLIYAGTSVAGGTGRAVVYATGMLTQFGRIARLTQEAPEDPSPFQRELSKVTLVSSLIALGIGAFILLAFFSGNLPTLPQSSAFTLALGLIVAAIPEGLPATLNISLAIAVQRLAGRGVLVKKLNTVETMGRVSVICTDKSGTLTQNQMTTRLLWTGGQEIRVSGVGCAPQGEFSPAPAGQPWQADLLSTLRAASRCNNARLLPPDPQTPFWHSLGDQTEAALKVAALKAGLQEETLAQEFPRVYEIPFDARRKRMTTIHRKGEIEIAFVKGAPREVLQLCTSIQMNGETLPLTEDLRASILASNDRFARRALRVLAVAQRFLPPKDSAYRAEEVETGLTFLGLTGMMDPPRPEVEAAVQVCRQASIRIVMITGDYGLTAESVARRVGLLQTDNPRILTGAELDEMSDLELQKVLRQEVLFARMAPEHKMRLVAAFQAIGETVAVTGDGVNDAPALRKADVGVAMGRVGTDVAKEAADIILTADNFGAIVSAIAEGRAVYDNIRKFVTYIFASNVPEIAPFLLSAFFPVLPLALKVRQVLAIDLGTDFLPAVALGMDEPAPNIMHKPPRPRSARLIDGKLLSRAFLWLGMLETALCFVAFFSVYLFSDNAGLLFALPWLSGLPYPHFFHFTLSSKDALLAATTLYHAGLVMSQVGNAFACRSESWIPLSRRWLPNWRLWAGVGLEIAGIFALVYLPRLNQVFSHYPIPLRFWLGLFAFPFLLILLESARKGLVYLLQTKSTEVSP